MRPHSCLLGGRQLRPLDRRGALVLSSDVLEEVGVKTWWSGRQERWRRETTMEIQCFKGLDELLEASLSAAQNACTCWEALGFSWLFDGF